MDSTRDTFYQMRLAYEVPYDILNDDDPEVSRAREILYERISSRIPESLSIFSSSLVMHKTDTCNYIFTYELFCLDSINLPMSSYTESRSLCEDIKSEFIDFFSAIGIKYKVLNVKSLL